MAKPPIPIEELHAKFGPHPNDTPPGGWQGRGEAERLVKTHCCFCGQQCGIQLKVRENKVIGFEPWEEFPFNRGKLCPKGVKRYMQGSHPDRLLSPLKNVPGRGFEPISWDEALSATVREIQRIQKEHGPNAFAMLSGVSLTNEKSYLVGKFARLALQTAELDYNGRLCMVSAGTGNKKAFGIDRAANYWEDILLADVILCAGTNVAECSPITTDYIWRARDRGAKLIMIDPRVTPMARTCDLHLPVRPGADSALLSGILRVMIEEGLVAEAFIRDHTSGWEETKAAALGMSLEEYSEISGVLVEDIVKAGKLWGEAKTSFLLHARGIEHHTKGVDNVLACINLVLATGRIGRPGCGYGTITGQGNGQGGREHGHKCDQLPGNRDIENPEHRAYIASVWGVDESEIPGKGHTAQEIMNMIHSGEIKGLLSICFNPLVSLPDAGFTREALNRLEHYTAIDFFLNETAHHADIVLAGSLHEEEEGTSTSAEGRVIRIRKAVDPPGEARTDTSILLEIARRLGRGQYFDHFETSEDIFNELRVASKGGTADYYGITYERIEQEMGVFWPCPEIGHPGTPRLFEEHPHTSPAPAREVGEQSEPGGGSATPLAPAQIKPADPLPNPPPQAGEGTGMALGNTSPAQAGEVGERSEPGGGNATPLAPAQIKPADPLPNPSPQAGEGTGIALGNTSPTPAGEVGERSEPGGGNATPLAPAQIKPADPLPNPPPQAGEGTGMALGNTSPAPAGEVGEQSEPGGGQAGYRRFFTPDGKAHFHPTPHRPSAEEPDEEYPVILTTGRVVSHYLSGTQTRRIGGLVALCPDPYVEIHPTLAAQHGIEDGHWMKVESRRGSVVLRAKVVTTIRPDTIFIPYHWPGGRSANNLTNRALDPLSKIPEFKKSVVRISACGPGAA